MCENLKNRAVIINKRDHKDFEFMLWLYDLRIIHSTNFSRDSDCEILAFRCSDEQYLKLYEKMDSLGMWKGELVEPKFTDRRIFGKDINLVDDESRYRRLVIGVL